MSKIVRDDGFHADDFTGPAAVELASDTDPAQLESLIKGAEMVICDFPSFADGRGFTLGRRLRDSGFTGRLRARGHVLADQYAMARRSGFDEVEITDELAERQPEDQWLARANWREHSYRRRLAG
ncbi:oxidoreductase [Thioclava sp. SK-1]|uniref:DUF934 domain-containing protein n=1 Tax=Thioclava sp. SK-1 TaxID=1889770 RepID=UPI0008267715|nr:DUF934 domain-containing protein [Thioclava sp. SK-1]OCX67203.1 oxidoreductase [Thioclava sp. SK-1]